MKKFIYAQGYDAQITGRLISTSIVPDIRFERNDLEYKLYQVDRIQIVYLNDDDQICKAIIYEGETLTFL